jgi:hypothetical protein
MSDIGRVTVECEDGVSSYRNEHLIRLPVGRNVSSFTILEAGAHGAANSGCSLHSSKLSGSSVSAEVPYRRWST